MIGDYTAVTNTQERTRTISKTPCFAQKQPLHSTLAYITLSRDTLIIIIYTITMTSPSTTTTTNNNNNIIGNHDDDDDDDSGNSISHKLDIILNKCIFYWWMVWWLWWWWWWLIVNIYGNPWGGAPTTWDSHSIIEGCMYLYLNLLFIYLF